MIAFLIIGLVLGMLARGVAGDAESPSAGTASVVGVAAATVGGVGVNLLTSAGWHDLSVASFAMAAILGAASLGILVGFGRA